MNKTTGNNIFTDDDERVGIKGGKQRLLIKQQRLY